MIIPPFSLIIEEAEEKCNIENNKLHIVYKENILNYQYDEELQKFDYKNYKNINIFLFSNINPFNIK